MPAVFCSFNLALILNVIRFFLQIAIEAVSNVRTVASLGREQKIVSEYVAELQPALAPARRSAHCRGLVAGLSRSMFNFVNAAALTYGGHLIVSDRVPCENILM